MKYVAIDTETTGLDAYKEDLVLVSCWDEDGVGTVERYPDIRVAADYLNDPTYTKLFYNAKYDLKILERHGLFAKGDILDVMILARLVHGSRALKLKNLARIVLEDPCIEEIKVKKWLKDNTGKASDTTMYDNWAKIPMKLLEPYALKDAQITYELFYVFASRLTDKLKKLLKQEHRVLAAVRAMEDRGLKVDRSYCASLLEQATRDYQTIETKMKVITGREDFKIGSNKQLAEHFYRNGVRPTRWTPKGNPSMDRLALMELEAPEAQLVLEYKNLKKASSTYLKAFLDKSDEEGIIRSSFNQAGPITGRFSNNGPNLQNIPRPEDSMLGMARNCIVARDGYMLVFIDYDQVELRLAAHWAKEPAMIKVINAGGDLHGLTCEKVFGITEDSPEWKEKRQVSKTLNFAILYGISAPSFRDTLLRTSGIKLPVSRCTEIIETYKATYPNIQNLFDKARDSVYAEGGIRNAYGRLMKYPARKSYIGVNYWIQSTSADLMKEKMAKCYKRLKGSEDYLVATIHDELVFELKENGWRKLARELRDIMQDLTRFRVPITCSIAVGKRWGTKKEVRL